MVRSDRIQARALELSVDAFGRLVMVDQGGVRHVGVEPVACFPITGPGGWVSICDDRGREVACFESLDGLDPAARALLERELALREFVPIITRIVGVSAESTPSDWDVVTDRGPTRFQLDDEDDIRQLGPDRVLISDARGLRFAIPDIRALDPSSRRVLDRYL